MSPKRLHDALKNQKQHTEQYNQKISGMLGIPLNGQRVVEVPNRNSYVFVRLRNSQNEIIQAFNNRVAPSYNLPILVERQGGRYRVVDVDTQRYENNWSSYSPYLARHGNTHSHDPESGGGGDIVWVHARQFMPLLGFPSGSIGSPNVIVSPYILRNDNGTWKYVGNTGTAGFTPYNPPNSGSAVMGLVALNTDTGNPYLLINSGSTFSNILTGTSQIYSFIPSLTNPRDIPIVAVRLVSGTSRLTWDNLYDVRQFLHPIATGSASGLSSIAVQDEGVSQGSVTTFNFVGSFLVASVSGSVANISFSGGGGGSGSVFTSDHNSAVLTDGSGTLFTPSWLKWGTNSQEFLEFGADVVGKETNAGKMGYETFGSDYFFIVGAGTGSSTRRVKIFDELYVNGNLYMNNGQQVVNVNQEQIEDYVGTMFTNGQHLGTLATYNDASGTVGLDSQSPADIRYGRIDGWQVHTGTWTRHSSDSPSFVARVEPYTAGFIFVGNKIDLFQLGSPSTDKYFFCTNIETSGSVGYLTLYGGTNYTLTTGTITGAKYSFDKVPAGFPIEPDIWTVQASDSSNRTQSSPSGSVWYNIGGVSITVPIGCWVLSWEALMRPAKNSATSISQITTLSTTPTSESDSLYSKTVSMDGASGNLVLSVSQQVNRVERVSVKKTFYLNAETLTATMGSIAHRGDVSVTLLRALCAYL